MAAAPLIGIVTPTYNRIRFLKSFIANLHKQTYKNFIFVLIHDGPSIETAKLAKKLFRDDPRMIYLETDRRGNDWGVSPRLLGIQYLDSLSRKPDYLAMWDDDNKFYKDALYQISEEAQKNQMADLLILNVLRDYRILPELCGPGRLDFSIIDTANIIPKFQLAVKIYPKVGEIKGDLYSQDKYFFLLLKQELQESQIHLTNGKILGRYDGLRLLYTLRIVLRIPTFEYFNRFSGYRFLRRQFRK